jgi:hypothetical protein
MSFQTEPRQILAQVTETLFPLRESNQLLLIGITKHPVRTYFTLETG